MVVVACSISGPTSTFSQGRTGDPSFRLVRQRNVLKSHFEWEKIHFPALVTLANVSEGLWLMSLERQEDSSSDFLRPSEEMIGGVLVTTPTSTRTHHDTSTRTTDAHGPLGHASPFADRVLTAMTAIEGASSSAQILQTNWAKSVAQLLPSSVVSDESHNWGWAEHLLRIRRGAGRFSDVVAGPEEDRAHVLANWAVRAACGGGLVVPEQTLHTNTKSATEDPTLSSLSTMSTLSTMTTPTMTPREEYHADHEPFLDWRFLRDPRSLIARMLNPPRLTIDAEAAETRLGYLEREWTTSKRPEVVGALSAAAVETELTLWKAAAVTHEMAPLYSTAVLPTTAHQRRLAYGPPLVRGQFLADPRFLYWVQVAKWVAGCGVILR